MGRRQPGLRPRKWKQRRVFFGGHLDRTERKWAEEALQKAQAELAHVTRVTTLGELTASITHDINQPLAAMATNANAALRWLSSDSPNLVEAHEAIRRIVRDGDRAGKIIEGGSCSGQESAAEDGLARPQRGDRRSRCYGAQ